ncbi:hypothetical protein D3C80_1659930 [compost metagenome]
MQQAVHQIGHVTQVVEEVADTGAQKARGDIAVTVDHRQEHPLVEAVVEVVDPTVPRLQRVIDVQGAEGRALEFALVQPRVELEFGQGFGEAVRIYHGRGVGLAVVGIGITCAEQRSEKQERFSHGRTPACRRR